MAPTLFAFTACGGGVTTIPLTLPASSPSGVVSEEQIDPSQPIRAIFETSAMQLHTLGTARVLFSFNETPAGVGGGVRIWVVNGTFEQRIYKHQHALGQYRRSAGQVTISGSVPLGGELGTLTFTGTISNGTFTFSGTDALGAVSGVTSRAGPYLTGPATVTAADERRMLSTGGCERKPPYLGTFGFGATGTGSASLMNPVSETNATVVLSSATNDDQGGYTYDGEFNGSVWGFPSSTTAFDGGSFAELEGDYLNVSMTAANDVYFVFGWRFPQIFGTPGPGPQNSEESWILSQYLNWYEGNNPITC